MDFIDYRKKLGIGFDNRELENFFFTRMWNMLDNNIFICNRITVDEYFDFCMAIGYLLIMRFKILKYGMKLCVFLVRIIDH